MNNLLTAVFRSEKDFSNFLQAYHTIFYLEMQRSVTYAILQTTVFEPTNT